MASMVESSARSIWETRPGVTPMVSASWARVRPAEITSIVRFLVTLAA
jgi:hypothetical protein